MNILKTGVLIAAIALGACTSPDRFGPGSGAGAGADGALGSVNDPTSPAYFNATVGDRVLFAVDQSTLSVEAQSVLAGQAQWLMANGEYTALVEGHADEQGTQAYNLALGARRASAVQNYLISQGVEEVFHLKGGILKYLEDVPAEKSLWNGECFVFDGRVSVGHGLAEGSYDLCHACRRPLSDGDKARAQYEPGVSCHRCQSEFTDSDRSRFRERQRQIELARARGEEHLGTG